MIRGAWFLSLLLALVACADPIPPPLPGSFERPGNVALVCFDSTTDEPVPLERCNDNVDTGIPDVSVSVSK